jgi:hypothetical protein
MIFKLLFLTTNPKTDHEEIIYLSEPLPFSFQL